MVTPARSALCANRHRASLPPMSRNRRLPAARYAIASSAGPWKLAGRIPRGVPDEPLHVGVARDAGAAQQLGVHIDHVAALVHQEHRAGRRHPVQVRRDHAAAAEEDGIEPPTHRRLVRVGETALGSPKSVHDLVDALESTVDDAVRRGPIEVAEIGVLPRAAFPGVAVPLDEARNDHLVGESVVDLVCPPSGQVVQRAGAQNPAVANRDVGRLRAAAVHREDLARCVDGRRHRGISCEERGGERHGKCARAISVRPFL